MEVAQSPLQVMEHMRRTSNNTTKNEFSSSKNSNHDVVNGDVVSHPAGPSVMTVTSPRKESMSSSSEHDDDSSNDSRLERFLRRRLNERKVVENTCPGQSTQEKHSPLDHPLPPPPPPPTMSRTESPYASYYNAYSQHSYSPHPEIKSPPRLMNHSVWMSPLASSPRTDRKEREQQQQEEVDGEADSDSVVESSASMDSAEELEQRAKQIWLEIRNSEMIELAQEAERAADAGHEKFAGRPSMFGDDMDIVRNSDVDGLKPKKLRRFQTYSEGTSLLRNSILRSHLEPKIPLLSLRNVNEVIPPFEELQSHLRTHLASRGVNQRTLLKELPSDTVGLKHGVESPNRHVQGRIFRKLASWVGSASSKDEDDQSLNQFTTPHPSRRGSAFSLNSLIDETDDYGEEALLSFDSSSEVGLRLADHLHTPPSTMPSEVPSPVQIPEGLMLPQCLDTGGAKIKKPMATAESETLKTAPTLSSSDADLESSTPNDAAPTKLAPRTSELLLPKALFVAEEEEGVGEKRCDVVLSEDDPMPARTAETSPRSSSSKPFLTPERLKGIKNGIRNGIAYRPSETEYEFMSIEMIRERLRSSTPEDSLIQPKLEDSGEFQPTSTYSHETSASHDALLPNPRTQPCPDFNPDDPSFINPDGRSSAIRNVGKVLKRRRSLHRGLSPYPEFPVCNNWTKIIQSQDRDAVSDIGVSRILFPHLEPREQSEHESAEGGMGHSKLPIGHLKPSYMIRDEGIVDEEDDLDPSPSDEVPANHDVFRTQNKAQPADRSPPKHALSRTMSLPSFLGTLDEETSEENSGQPTPSPLHRHEPAARPPSSPTRRSTTSFSAAMDLFKVPRMSDMSPSRRSESGDSTAFLAAMDLCRSPVSPGRSPGRRSASEAGTNTSFSAAVDLFMGLGHRRNRANKREDSTSSLYIPAAENNAFLSNYLYCSKLPEVEHEVKSSSRLCRNPCGDAGIQITCGGLSSMLGGALGVFPKQQTETEAGNNTSIVAVRTGYASLEGPERWLEVAAEKLDLALERFIGGSNSTWNTFHAPTLKKRTPSGASTPARKPHKKVAVVPKAHSADSFEGRVGDFESMYGMTRQEFAMLPVMERTRRHDEIMKRHLRRQSWQC